MVKTLFIFFLKRVASLYPVPLFPHGLIQPLDGIPNLLPLAARPGISRHRRLTLKAFWPGGLVPRFPTPDSFALLFAPLGCPSFAGVAHGLPPIVCFARVLFLFRAWALAQNAPDQPRRCSPVAARGRCWLASQMWLAVGISDPPAPI